MKRICRTGHILYFCQTQFTSFWLRKHNFIPKLCKKEGVKVGGNVCFIDDIVVTLQRISDYNSNFCIN